VLQQLREEGTSPQVILEPEGRNTAPAVAVAALAVARRDLTSPLLLVMPSDHVIRDPAAFSRAVEIAIPAASAGRLVTFGIAPTHAETGYGYIRAAARGAGPQDVVRFVKPTPRPLTLRSVRRLLWNNGMFLFSRRLSAGTGPRRQRCSRLPTIAGAQEDTGFLQLALARSLRVRPNR
jgi:mannose-1-phosphate guanylyltransferase